MSATAGAATEPLFSIAHVRDDLDATWEALLDVGADPFRSSNRARVEALYRKTRAGIVRDMTIREAWLTVASVLGALNDGHVGLGFPGAMNRAPRRFPLRFALSDGNDIIVIHDFTKTVPLGSRLISVEDVSAAKFRATALATMGGQTNSLHRTRITGSGAWPSIALFGARATYDVRWTAVDGSAHRASVEASTPTTPESSISVKPYDYHTIERGRIGFIDYRRCEDNERFARFIDDTLDAIQTSPIRALIIDIRQNSGGDSSLNDTLWLKLSVKPFKQSGGSIERVSARLKREYGHQKYAEVYGQAAWTAPDGVIIRSVDAPDTDLVVHEANDVTRYKSPIYLLIGPQTFSSAMTCALAAKDYGLATIVGEETGEPVDSTGEVYTFVTPHLCLQAYLTTKVFLPPRPHPPGQGVIPDVIVQTTVDDRVAGRDPVLERTLDLIRLQPAAET